ncbi:Histone acetyltransferase KAT6A [Gossypium arboreum]|uniref:Histone acetyltransferase KAT6A n=1 Tax=Gossypium arboreum TaxID=29729 RepID=A0A0B0P433_GOSAR|nr:Histone acetyltransferase KAT6A [Gossypium arboreum]
MSGNETWQMTPKCDGTSQSGCKEAGDSCLPFPKIGSQQSSVSMMFESPTPILVYRRKKRWGCSSSASAVVANFCAQELVNSKRSVDCFSVLSSNALSEAVMEQKGVSRVEHETATKTSLCDWMSGNETWQMIPKCDGTSQAGCKEAEESCLPLPKTGSQQPSVSVMFESPMPISVYSRGKKRWGSSSSASSVVANFYAREHVNSKRRADCLSVVSSDALSEAVMERKGVSQVEHETATKISLCDWMSGNETCKMTPKCDGTSQSGCKEAEDSCLPLPKTGSQQSSVSMRFESPIPILIYRMKKRWGRSSSANAVVANFCAQELVNSKRSADCLSVVSSDALSEAVMERKGVSQVDHETATKISLCDWISDNETFRMTPKCDSTSQPGCKEAEDSRLPLPETGSQRLSVSVMFESPMPILVYSRRKKRWGSSSIASAAVANFCAQEPVNSKRSTDCLSVVSSDVLSEAVMGQKGVPRVEHEIATVRAPVMPLACSRGPHISKYEIANGCSGVYDHISDDVHKTVVQKTIDVDSINDSCSSSKSNMELALASTKDEMDENGECSSSSVIAAEVAMEDLSEKDACHNILRNQGNVDEVGPSRNCVNEETGITSGGSCSRFCKSCSRSGTVQKMLICDSCEEAFHVRCCTPRIKKLPVDEWYCIMCMKQKRIMLKETTASKPSSITGVMGRSRDKSTKGEFSPIELMLRDTEPYRTSVRIGKGFQAEIPDWSGPIDNDVDNIGEPLELDPSEFTDFRGANCNKSSKLSLIGNWLQCREFIEGVGGTKGTICGKWRRAPLLEVQTDNWECFCCVQWDPSLADCSVPQELETEEVLKQLKYLEMLRPRLSADRRKSDRTNNCTSQDRKCDMRNAKS